MTKQPLTFLTEDSKHVTPNPLYLGMQLRHLGNQKLYVITGFCWLGATDEWGFLHQELTESGVPGVPLARPLDHIFGLRANGQYRYQIETRIKAVQS